MERKTLEEAVRLIRENVQAVGTESLPASLCLGRTLAEDVYADIDYPPFPRSAMDGYAVKSRDTKEASQQNPAVLGVIDRVCAGEVSGKTLSDGQAVRIMTGAAIPKGADCVIRQEDTDYGKEQVQVFHPGTEGKNCCQAGEDFQKGDRIAERGQEADASVLAALTVAGKDLIKVYRRIRTAVITTGDELCTPGEELGYGKIYDSNRVYFTVRLQQMGCSVGQAECVGDDPETIRSILQKAAENADLIITTGGVSVGEKDYLPGLVKEMGGRLIFHGIHVKPGMPTMLFTLGKTFVLSLSGNPCSAAAVFEFLIPYILGSMQKRKTVGLLPEEGRLANHFSKKTPVRRLIRGIVSGNEIYLPDKQSNGMIRNGIGCNCLVDIPEGSGILQEGSKVRFYRI